MTDTTDTINIDLSSTDLVEKVDNAVQMVAQQLGMASDHFYPIMVEQQHLEGWIWVFSTIPLFLVAVLFTAIGALGMRAKEGSAIGWLFAAVVIYIISITILGHNITKILNPEYHALMQIKEFIK